jgi:EAL domain-containing protein (putative c-di-GMP-specific phosphodiesterase class I)
LEKVEDVELLQQMGCEVGQGNIFSKPMSKEEFLALLKRRTSRRA